MPVVEPSLELRRLDAAVRRPDFSCGNGDLDEFFHIDSIAGCNELMSVTYALMHDGKCMAFFSLSNDSIRRNDIPRTTLRRMLRKIPREKRYASLPAAKIGRLGVARDAQRAGHGTQILDYLKHWFTHGNKTGCRFLTIDAYNNPEAIAFYRKNEFEFLTVDDAREPTRIMYFDLILYANRAAASGP